MITIDDIRDAGYCVSGAKYWFDRQGLDFRDFLKNGISESDFLATNDEHALRVVEMKRRRENG